MKAETAKSLHDALSACAEVEHFTRGVSRAQFDDNRGLQLIVERLLTIVGEALYRAWRSEEEILDPVPEFRRVIGLRNRIVHGYDEIDNDIIWDVIVTKGPELRRNLRAMLDATEPL